MTQEEFNKIKKTQDNIESCKEKIRKIDSLINSCGIDCVISGTHINSFRIKYEYRFSNKEEIIKLLNIDKLRLEKELTELEEEFSKL